MYWFVEGMQAINDNTKGVRSEMQKMHIPDFNAGGSLNRNGNVYFKGDIWGHEVFNTENYAQYKGEQVAVRKAEKEIEKERQDYFNKLRGTDIIGVIDFSYNMAGGNQYLGTGITALSTYLTGIKAFSDYNKGGWKKVSKSDMISTSAGVVSVTAKAAQWIGIGGKTVLYVGESASGVGNAAFVYDLWMNAVYKPMNDLRYASSCIGSDGVPYYGDDLPPNAYWGAGY